MPPQLGENNWNVPPRISEVREPAPFLITHLSEVRNVTEFSCGGIVTSLRPSQMLHWTQYGGHWCTHTMPMYSFFSRAEGKPFRLRYHRHFFTGTISIQYESGSLMK